MSGGNMGEREGEARPRLETDVFRNLTKLRRNQESYLPGTEAGDYSNILQPLTFPSFNSAAKFPQNPKVDKMIPASSWCRSSPAFCQSLSLC